MGEKIINGETYKVDVVLATRALELQARLFKVGGPLTKKLPSLIAQASVGGSEKDIANAALIEAIGELFSNIDTAEYVRLVKDIVELASIKRPSGVYDPVDFDGDFSSRLNSVLPVSVFVLKEVLGDFFSGLQGNGRLP